MHCLSPQTQTLLQEQHFSQQKRWITSARVTGGLNSLTAKLSP